MWTTWLAYLIAFMGFITFAAGALGSVLIFMLEVVGLRYYAMVIALISGGLSMIGIAQGLRRLLLLVKGGA
jgi:hypothetical protein